MENINRNVTSEYALTIIAPVYNEVESLAALEAAFAEYLPRCRRKACLLLVNDGSSDGSGELIVQMCKRHRDFYHITFSENRGLSAALLAGFEAAESELVGYIDADLQTYPEDFDLLLEHMDEASLVIGIRAKRNDSLSKRLQSKVANWFRRLMTGDTAHDTGCPLKVLRSATAKRLPMFTGMHRFLPALVSLQEGGRYVEVPVRHRPRQAGKSKFSLSNRLLGPLNDCFAFRWMRSRYINYHVAAQDIDGARD